MATIFLVSTIILIILLFIKISNTPKNKFKIKNGVLVEYAGNGGDVIIPEGVTSIGTSAFANCDNLISVTIPNSVTRIEEMAFLDCASLIGIIIPEGVTSIGGWAFGWCSSITSVYIPNSVTEIGHEAFIGCKNIIIYTTNGSCAEECAKEHGVPVEYV